MTEKKNAKEFGMSCSLVESFQFFTPLKPPTMWQVWLSTRTHTAAVSAPPTPGLPKPHISMKKKKKTPFYCRAACVFATETGPHTCQEDGCAETDLSKPNQRGNHTYPGKGNFRQKTPKMLRLGDQQGHVELQEILRVRTSRETDFYISPNIN